MLLLMAINCDSKHPEIWKKCLLFKKRKEQTFGEGTNTIERLHVIYIIYIYTYIKIDSRNPNSDIGIRIS